MIYLHQKQELTDIKSVIPYNSIVNHTCASDNIITSNSGLIFQAVTKFNPISKITLFHNSILHQHIDIQTYILLLN